ncbi:MAG: AAA family ATPase [Bacteroidales bacterium]|nr:AAA family ATPase [Bacteroidales bacterium]
MKTITFYSYKGGVGRTLALSNIAKRLNEFGKKVFIIDFDLEAPGVHYKFKDFLRYDSIKKGLVDYIYEFCSNNNVDSDIDSYVRSFKINNRSKSGINLMCAGNNYSSEYWKKLSTINWSDLFYKDDSEGIELFLNLKKVIQEKYNPDYLLIDSRTGFTETSAITMSIMADEVMIFSANNIENIEGSKQVIKSINKTLSLTNNIIKTHFILTRIPGGNSPEDKNIRNKIKLQVDYQLNSESDPDKKLVDTIHVIHTDRDLEIKETFKIGEEQKPDTISISKDYFNLLKVIGNFTVEELNKYNSILKSDQIYYKALRMPRDKSFKYEMEEALKLNKNNVDVMYQLSLYYYSNLFIDEGINYMQKAVAIEPNNASMLLQLGAILVTRYYFTNEINYVKNAIEYMEIAIQINKENRKVDVIGEIIYTNALQYLGNLSDKEYIGLHEELLDRFPHSPIVYNSMAVFHQEMENIESAYDCIYKALEKDSNNSLYITTLAEIHEKADKKNEFYYNIGAAINAGYEVEGFFYYHKFYSTYFNDEKFLAILEKYNKLDKFYELLERYNKLIEKVKN